MDDPTRHPDPLEALSPLLAMRVRRLARLWELDALRALEQVLERGLFECEAELRARFTPTEMDAWRAAIVALQRQPDDAGYALIGRTGAGTTGSADEPAEPPPGQAIPPRDQAG